MKNVKPNAVVTSSVCRHVRARMPRSCALVALAMLALIASACGDKTGADPCAGRAGAAGTREISLESGGIERSFTLIVPQSALGGHPVPLVLVFHGVISDGQMIEAVTGLPDKAAEEGFITAAGDGVGQSWNAGVCCNPAEQQGIDDVGFTRAMVAAIEAEYCVDPARVYATGFSNGSAMVFRLACEASDLFVAFAPVGGSLALFPCTPERPRPIDIINNVSDPIVPFALGPFSFDQFLRLNSCSAARVSSQPASNAACQTAPDCAAGATTSLCAVEGLGHDWPGGSKDPDGAFKATDAVWDFFQAHPGG